MFYEECTRRLSNLLSNIILVTYKYILWHNGPFPFLYRQVLLPPKPPPMYIYIYYIHISYTKKLYTRHYIYSAHGSHWNILSRERDSWFSNFVFNSLCLSILFSILAIFSCFLISLKM